MSDFKSGVILGFLLCLFLLAMVNVFVGSYIQYINHGNLKPEWTVKITWSSPD